MNSTTIASLNFDWIRKKPSTAIVGIDLDYYKLFYAMKCSRDSCFLFESLALPRHQDRYYTLGFDPILEFIAKNDQLTIKGSLEAIEKVCGVSGKNEITLDGINPYDFIKQNIPLDYTSSPHQGGLVGYFSYEAINYFENAVNLDESPDFATFHLGLYLDGVVYDATTGIMTYHTFAKDREHEVLQLIDIAKEVIIPSTLTSVDCHGHNITHDEYVHAVEQMLEGIRAGNTFQGEVGFKTEYTIKGDKMAVYDKLRQINPSPYMFYLKFADVELIGASPEILVSSTDGAVLTTPTAGTIRRDADPQIDRALARQLLTDPKEIAEHRMLVDLHRNDISRVCKVGSVKVNDLMYIIPFSHVQHIVSDIQGELDTDKTSYDLLSSILPGGVLTGAPKIETIKIISKNEKAPRGPYGGAIGRFSMNGDSVFCLPIRSLFCKGDKCFTQTSSGVVFDSNAEKEYEEVTHKLTAVDLTINIVAEQSKAQR